MNRRNGLLTLPRGKGLLGHGLHALRISKNIAPQALKKHSGLTKVGCSTSRGVCIPRLAHTQLALPRAICKKGSAYF